MTNKSLKKRFETLFLNLPDMSKNIVLRLVKYNSISQYINDTTLCFINDEMSTGDFEKHEKEWICAIALFNLLQDSPNYKLSKELISKQ